MRRFQDLRKCSIFVRFKYEKLHGKYEVVEIKGNIASAIPLLFLNLKNKPLPVEPQLMDMPNDQKIDILPPPPPPPPPPIQPKEPIPKKVEKPVEKKVEKLPDIKKQNIEKKPEIKQEPNVEKKEEIDISVKDLPWMKKGAEKELQKKIKEAEKQAVIERKEEKKLEKEKSLKEKEKLKYQRYMLKLEKKEVKKNNKIYLNDIKDILLRLDSGIKAIDKHEHILQDELDKNLKLKEEKIKKIKEDLKQEDLYLEECDKIRIKLETVKKLQEKGKVDLKQKIDDLKKKYEEYTQKGEGLRNAILAKIDFIGKKSKDIEKEQQKEKEMEEEKKKILEVEKMLARNRFSGKVKGILSKAGIYKTQKDIEKEKLEKINKKKQWDDLIEQRKKEREHKLEEEKKSREHDIKTHDKIIQLRQSEDYKAKKEQKDIEKMGIYEKLRNTEQKREKEKEKLMKGKPFIHIFKPKNQTPEDEIKKAISKLKKPGKKQVIAKNVDEINDIDYINKQIQLARDSLLKLDINKAKKTYIDILKIYNNLSTSKKKSIYSSIKELYDERKGAERIVKR